MQSTTIAALSLVLALSSGGGAGAATPKAKARAAAPAGKVLVKVGNEAITLDDVEKRLTELPEQARAQFSTPEGRQQLVERMVEERVWLLAAKRKGVEARPQVQQQLAAQKRDLVIRTYLGEVMAENPAPSDSEAQAYYDLHRAEYEIPATVTIRHIQTKTEAEAKNVLRQVTAKNAQPWDKLVTRYSTDTLSKSRGGLQSPVTKEGLFASLGRQPALAESAFALGQGKIGGPYRSDKGWHVVKVDEVKPPGARPFESVRRTIVQQLSTQRTQNYYREALERERKRLGVTPDSAAIKRYVSQKKPAREMFKAAQELGPAADRLAAYQQLLRDYPDSDVSPQAQFMIGFIHSEEMKNYDEAEKAFRAVLDRYPRSELAASAKWMVEHMRTEEAPAFVPMEADSNAATPRAGVSPGKP